MHLNDGHDGLQKSGVFSDCSGGNWLLFNVVRNSGISQSAFIVNKFKHGHSAGNIQRLN